MLSHQLIQQYYQHIEDPESPFRRIGNVIIERVKGRPKNGEQTFTGYWTAGFLPPENKTHRTNLTLKAARVEATEGGSTGIANVQSLSAPKPKPMPAKSKGTYQKSGGEVCSSSSSGGH